ncbi:MAG: flagellar biosynthesis protein FliQ [Spirochaetia bacterium]
MDLGEAIFIMRSSIFQVLLMAAPILVIGLLVGLIVSVIQATTSIQEQTLTFVPKIAAILGSLIFFGPWIFSSMTQFAINIITRIPDMVR